MDEFVSIDLDDICIKGLKKSNNKKVKNIKLENIIHDGTYVYIYDCESVVNTDNGYFLAVYTLHIKATPEDIESYKIKPRPYNEALTKTVSNAMNESGWVYSRLKYNIYKYNMHKT